MNIRYSIQPHTLTPLRVSDNRTLVRLCLTRRRPNDIKNYIF
jgi:hypothetical protein